MTQQSQQIDGLGDSQNSSFIYLSIRNGKIAKPATEEIHDYVETSNTTQKKYYYTLHPNVNGYIEGVKKFEKEMPDYVSKTLMIHIRNNKTNFSLSMNANSGIASAFYMCMENIDFSKPVQFSASIDKLNPKRNKLWIRQDDQLISYKYTRDNPLNLPQAQRYKLEGGGYLQENGKDKLNFDAQMKFLWNIIENNLTEKIEAAKAARNQVAAAQNSAAQDQDFMKADNLDQTEVKESSKAVKQEVEEEQDFPSAEVVFGAVNDDPNSPV